MRTTRTHLEQPSAPFSVPGSTAIKESIRYLEAEDGHPIALHAYAAAEDAPHRTPVLLVHGLGANRHNFDLFGDSDALPRQLARLGHDAYVLELRGVGMSRAPRGIKNSFGVDNHLRFDIPVAVDYVLDTHRTSELHWVGHSMGAMLGYIYGGAYPERFKSLTAVAGPVPRAVPVPLRSFLLPLRHMLKRSPVKELPNRWGLAAFKRVPRLARLAYNGTLFHGPNLSDEWLVKIADHCLENVPLSILHRLGEWVAEGGEHSNQMESALGGLFVNTLFIGATLDPLCPPSVVEHASRLMPAGYARTRIVSKDHGFGCNFGHGDILVSPAAKREVFPLVLDFIAEREGLVSRSPRS